MKNKTLFLVIMIVVLDLIAAYNVINSSIDPHAHDYENAIKAAEEYEEQGLCSRAISAYSFANEIKDSYDLRMKIADLYEKGYLNGEFQSLSGKYSTLDNVINAYPDETESYDMLIWQQEPLMLLQELNRTSRLRQRLLWQSRVFLFLLR